MMILCLEYEDDGKASLSSRQFINSSLCHFYDNYKILYVREKLGGKALCEYRHESFGDSLLNKYIYAGSQRIAMIDKDGDIHFYLTDHLGSTRLVIDSTGTIEDKYSKYYAFGDKAGATVSTNQKYRYTGKPYDEEGNFNLYYYGARYYDSYLGRFPAIDPMRGKYPSLSPYNYTKNNPLKNIDPDGKDSFLFTWAPKGEQVGHSAIGTQVRDQSGNPTGDVQVRHLWPANPVGKSGTAPADYRTETVSDLSSFLGGEGRSADGIIRIQGDATQDQAVNTALNQAESNNTYNAETNSCATYTQTGLNATGVNTGSGGTVTVKIPLFPDKTINSVTTPVSVHNGVVNSGNSRVTILLPIS